MPDRQDINSCVITTQNTVLISWGFNF